MRLLLTRPEPDIDRTAAALSARGHEVLAMPLLRIAPVADARIGAGPWGALLLTSANAARALAAHGARADLVRLPVFAVGARTADAARAVGFADVVSAEGDVAALARLVVARVADRSAPLLYAAGETRAGDLAGALAAHGFQVRLVVVYRTQAVDVLTPAVRAALAAGAIDAVLHFSRRSAESFLAAASAAGLSARSLKIQHYCLSTEVAAPLAAAGAGDIRIAPAPQERVLLDMLPGPAPSR